jgi:hypothetical protein
LQYTREFSSNGEVPRESEELELRVKQLEHGEGLLEVIGIDSYKSSSRQR